MHAELTHTFRAMASSVNLRVTNPGPDASGAVDRAISVINEVASTCTRFDSSSALMQANEAPSAWHTLPTLCSKAIRAAFDAYIKTDGRFDPRVLSSLRAIGYTNSRDFSETPVFGSSQRETVPLQRELWQPSFDGDRVNLGGHPIDLGGIGKGLAVRWAAAELQHAGSGYLVDAGGDIAFAGLASAGTPWRIGIENPWDPTGAPVVVLETADGAVATSSIRIRSWTHEGRTQHHIIDPSTGLPGGEGLVSVSVMSDDTADAEVWSKTLFLAGANDIRDFALERKLAAIWVTTDGQVAMTPKAAVRAIWQVSHAAH